MPNPIKILIVFLFIFNGDISYAQEIIQEAEIRKKRKIPFSGIILNYAGGAGLISTGVMHHPSKKTALSLTAGYVPLEYGNIWTGNLYFSFTGIPVRIYKNITLRMLETGIFINANFGNQLYFKWPSRYTDSSYYWWNSAIRVGPFTDASIIYSSPQSKYNMSLFIQCNTNDLYIASYYKNGNALRISDILVLGAGIKITKRSAQ